MIFFVLFTHSAIATDVCMPAMHSDHENITIGFDDDTDMGNDLGGHCAHSASHTAGWVSVATSLATTMQAERHDFCVANLVPFEQSPPFHPPKKYI